MELLTLENVVAHGFQVVCLAALATAIAALVRVDSAAVRYTFWRAVLVLALLLPFLQPLRDLGSAAKPSTPSAASVVTTAMGSAGPLQPSAAPIDWLPSLATILVVGAVARLLWIGAGILSLRRLRQIGEARPLPAELADIQQALGANADVRYVPHLEQPATFGLVRPVVLLPDRVREEAPAIQRALFAHELIHVRRRDWLWVLCEELLLAGFWFNPAMWWIVAQVRRAREEAVDELAVLVTGSRRSYVKALLTFAGDSFLSPAPAFAYRRHLFRRITLISTEADMSSSRIVFSSAVMALVVLTGSWYAAAAFPLTDSPSIQQDQRPGPLERQAKPVSAENPVPKRTDYQAPEYPAEARAIGASGIVTLRITINEVGLVAEARRTGFSLRSTDPEVSISLQDSSPEGLDALMNKAVLRGKDGRVADNRALLRVADAMTEAALNAIRNWRYQAPANGPIAFDVRVHFQTDGETSAVQNTGMVGTPLSSKINAAGAVRVGGTIKAPVKVKDVRPEYPAIAMQARVSGMVIIEARIGPDGAVEDAQVLRSIPLLDQAALDAVRQWRFTPTLLNGVPTAVIMTVTVNFTVQ